MKKNSRQNAPTLIDSGNIATESSGQRDPLKKYRFNSASIYFTYSQCPKEWTKEFIAEKMHSWGPLIKGVVGFELHKDKGHHFHLYGKYAKKFDTTNCFKFDIDGHHGNYQSPDSVEKVIAYCTEENDFLELGDMDVAQEIGARASNKTILGKRLMTEPLVVVARQNPSLMFGYKRLKADIEEFKNDTLVHGTDKPRCTTTLYNEWGFTLPVSDVVKKRHYWFWSNDTDQGKSHFFKKFVQPNWNTIEVGYHDGSAKYQHHRPNAQFIIFDAYQQPHFTVGDIEAMCEGTYDFPTKGGIMYRLPEATLLFASNKHPSMLYPNLFHVLEARIHFVELRGFKFTHPETDAFSQLLRIQLPGVADEASHSGVIWEDGKRVVPEDIKE